MPSNATNQTVLQDPVFAEDKLPQPFRRIDKLLNELIDGVVRYCNRQEAAAALRKQLDALPATSPTCDELMPPVKLCTLAERCCVLLHDDDTASVIDLETSTVTAAFKSGMQASCMATHDSLLALASASAIQIRALSLEHGAPVSDPICQAELLLKERPSSISFPPAGSLLAVCSASGITMLHYLTDAPNPLLALLHHNLPVGSDQDPMGGALHARDVQVAWQWDTRVAAPETSQQLEVHGMFGWQLGAPTLQLWSIVGTELASAAPSATWSLPDTLSAVSQSGEGSTLALGLSHGGIALWDCRMGIALTVVQPLAGAVVCMAFGPTQRQVIAIGADGTLLSVEAHGSFRQRVIAKHASAPAHLFLPRALEPCAVVIDAQPWQDVRTSEEILVYDVQSKAFVGKVRVNNSGRVCPPAQGAEATAGRAVSTAPRSDYTCDGNTLVRVTRQQAGGGACNSRIEIVRLEAALRGQPRATEGGVMVQRFLHDVQQQQQQTKLGQQQVPRPRVSIANDGPTSTLASFAQPTYSNEPRRQSCASSVTLDNDRGSTAAAVKVPPVPEDALETAALQSLMEAIALRCGGRRRRDRKVLRTMSALAAQLAKESNYSRTGLGLVLQT